MRILYLKLVKFKRFPLSCVEVFEHQFNAKMFMLSGPNGSGKSRTLNELTPLPSDKNDFYPGGSKEIRIDHEGKLYTLISDFTNGASFSFLVDGEELNTANLITTQKELVLQHFKISQVIHEIMTGKENFTNMSLLARKKLFSAITHLNIDKVLDGYNKLKEEHKVNTMLLKSLLNSYQIEEQKVSDKTHLESIKTSLSITKETMDKLLHTREEVARFSPYGTDEDAYKTLTGVSIFIKTMSASHYRLLSAYPNKDIPRIETSNSNKLTLINHQLGGMYNELEKKQRELKVVESNSISSQQNLLDTKEKLLSYVSGLRGSLKIFKDPSRVTEQTQIALYKLESTLPEILRNLQTNVGLDGERLFTTEKYNALVDKKRELVEKLQASCAMEISVNHNLNAANSSTGDVECPKCSHTWPLKEALTASIHAQDELEQIQIEQLKLRNAMGSTERSIEELTEYFTLYRQYLNIRKETSLPLDVLWDNINEKELIFTDPTSILSILNLTGLELSHVQEIKEAESTLQRIEEKLNTMVAVESLSLDTVKSDIITLNENITVLMEDKNTILLDNTNLTHAKQIYANLLTAETKLLAAQTKVTDLNMSDLVSGVVSVIDDELRNLKVTTLVLEKEIHQFSTVQYALDSYQKRIDDVKENLRVLDMAIVELCPKSGLIARSISSFLNTIIGSVNSVIKGIWEYKMILKPIDVETDSLNYKFKVEVEDRLVINDIAVVSSGMQEIINLAFKMTLYKLLNLDHYPIFLDEFGSKLDLVHRSKVFSIIFNMINDPRYSQIFMVTHIDTSIANYKDVEMIEI